MMINKKIKLLFALILTFQLIIPSTMLAAAVGQFTSVIGDVVQPRAGVATKPALNSSVESSDLIVTGDKSAASMFLIDESALTLGANSKLDVRELSIKDNSRKGFFSLAIGKLTANVRKFIGGDNVFEVRTPNAVAGVRGTGFEVVFMMVPQMLTNVTCMSGSMAVSSLSATGAISSTITIVAGQTATVTASGIVVSAAAGAAGAAGAPGAAGAGAGTAGTSGGIAAAGGVVAGTIAAGAAGAALVVGAAVASTGSETTTTHHVTTTHHH